MKHIKLIAAAALLAFSAISLPAQAVLIMSAPPRAKVEAEKQVYGPVAEYISKVLGEEVRYQHPVNWGLYQAEMQLGKYDIVFDGPHFAEWRVVKQNHEILVKTPGNLVFVVVVKDSDRRFQKLGDLAGRKICGLAPPNLATQTIFDEFKGGREPNLMLSASFPVAFKEMLGGRCTAVILAERMYKRLKKKELKKSRVIYTSKPYPNQTITVGSKVPAGKRALLKEKLVAPEAKAAMPRFVKQYTGNKGLKPANPADFKGMEQYLKDSWGFGI